MVNGACAGVYADVVVPGDNPHRRHRHVQRPDDGAAIAPRQRLAGASPTAQADATRNTSEPTASRRKATAGAMFQ